MRSNSQKKSTVLLALSGGVDSAAAAVLLKRRGFAVVGAFIKMWTAPSEQAACPWQAERRDAYAVGARLGLPVITLDFEAAYRREVLEEFYRAAARGETLNPDLLCNSRIKFPLLREAAAKRGINLVATGHYARVKLDRRGVSHLFAGRDPEKDQSYFLAGLTAADLRSTIFPVGGLLKSDVRRLARRAGLSVWNKRSTRGICFIGRVDLPTFLRSRLPDAPGPIVAKNGALLGRHSGVHYFTLGQRQGIGVGGGRPFYVLAKQPATRTLVVSPSVADLAGRVARLHDLHWIAGPPGAKLALTARARYRAPLVAVVLRGGRVRFAEPVRALTPGQAVVFYDGAECLGHGLIHSVAG